MTDRYQPLRDAIAAGPTKGPWRADRGKMRIAGSPTFYSVHDERGFDVVFWSGFDRYESKSLKARNSRYIAAADPDTIAALLRDNDRLRKALARIAEGAPSTEPEWIESDNHGDTADIASARAHYYYACIARAALTDGEASNG